MRMPGPAELRARLNRPFVLHDSSGGRWTAELAGVRDGTALSPRYVCYAAEFALPEGVHLPQAVYAVFAGEGPEPWPLLLTPVRPGEDGRARMEAVFHVEAASIEVAAPV